MNGRSTHQAALGVSGAADNWPLSARDAAAMLGISERTVRRAIGRGDLAAEKHGGVFRIDPANVARFGARIWSGAGRSAPKNPTAFERAGSPLLDLPAQSPGIVRGTDAEILSSQLGRALAAIHALTERRPNADDQDDPRRTLARRWEALTIVERLCASSLVAALTSDWGAELLMIASAAHALGFAGGADDASPAAIDPLTPREIGVLQLVAAGESNREIASSLFISVPTVKRHLTNVLGKLGVTSRYEAVQHASSRGLL